MDTYIVMTSNEKMPSSCCGRYRRVAVVELEKGRTTRPAMISERARGIVRIVQEWRRLNAGTTDRCAYEVALAEAEELAYDLNSR